MEKKEDNTLGKEVSSNKQTIPGLLKRTVIGKKKLVGGVNAE